MSRIVPGPIIGWAGGNRPDADLEQMAEAWGRIAAALPRGHLRRGGPPARPSSASTSPRSALLRVPWLHPEDYPKGLVGIDIGCCPLDDHPFNRSKSPIKAWEYALSGAAVVASPTVYGRVIRHAANGLPGVHRRGVGARPGLPPGAPQGPGGAGGEPQAGRAGAVVAAEELLALAGGLAPADGRDRVSEGRRRLLRNCSRCAPVRAWSGHKGRDVEVDDQPAAVRRCGDRALLGEIRRPALQHASASGATGGGGARHRHPRPPLELA